MHSLDLFLLRSTDPANAVALVKSGRHIAIEALNLTSEVREFAAMSTRVEEMSNGGARPTVAEIADMGTRLFDRIFTGRLRELYIGLPRRGTVSIQVVTDEEDMVRIPWEFLAPPDCKPIPHLNRCVVRVPAMHSSPEFATGRQRRALRVLLAVAEPPGPAAVGWEDIKADMLDVFEAFIEDVAELTVMHAASLPDLQKALTRKQYDVLHFLGHGMLVDGVGSLVLINPKTGKELPVSGEQFAGTVSNHGLRLCILSSCQSSDGRDKNSKFGTVANSLLTAGVPAVVANQATIRTDSVAPFVAALYQELIVSGNIDTAVTAGRIALNGELRSSIPKDLEVVEWGIPTLYRLSGADQLFTPMKR